MAEFPRWRGLDHFTAPTAIDFTEGNAFLALLKFLKWYYTCHAASDIREKGAIKNMSTRPGGGFQQEVIRHYNQTNGRDAERQMVVIDENEEAMARLDMNFADAKAFEDKLYHLVQREPECEKGGVRRDMVQDHAGSFGLFTSASGKGGAGNYLDSGLDGKAQGEVARPLVIMGNLFGFLQSKYSD
ncbi:hypothetical protein DFH08DRAFT_802393 [Mycena albidolilacea]|uniref:Uncharacterized protein n=1 Tax=Mycena albidolilacea TaxID=1033008 RepID=A0AAD7AH87_9AGAR|nr:hypothetical protein DFH08DRAFT_802393 [Mycena albidolilacea]